MTPIKSPTILIKAHRPGEAFEAQVRQNIKDLLKSAFRGIEFELGAMPGLKRSLIGLPRIDNPDAFIDEYMDSVVCDPESFKNIRTLLELDKANAKCLEREKSLDSREEALKRQRADFDELKKEQNADLKARRQAQDAELKEERRQWKMVKEDERRALDEELATKRATHDAKLLAERNEFTGALVDFEAEQKAFNKNFDDTFDRLKAEAERETEGELTEALIDAATAKATVGALTKELANVRADLKTTEGAYATLLASHTESIKAFKEVALKGLEFPNVPSAVNFDVTVPAQKVKKA